MGLLTTLLGGSKQTSESKNLAYPYLKDAYSGQVSAGTGAASQMQALLGMGGDAGAANAAFDQYKDSAGYQSVLNSGIDAITGSGAARGLLRSGSTGKAYTSYAQDTAKTYFQQYLQNLLGLSGQGLQAGGLIGQAGQVNNQMSKSSEGIGKMLGAAMSMAPMLSDPRLKTEIEQIGTAENGLGIYQYRYIWDAPATVRIGYMADEVAELAPEALGPELDGYMTVYYSKLPKIEGN